MNTEGWIPTPAPGTAVGPGLTRWRYVVARTLPATRVVGAAGIAGLVLALLATPAQAVSVAQVSPFGEVGLVDQITLRFDADAVPQGDPRLPAPATVRCEGQPIAGNSRWVAARQWVLDLPAPLLPGQTCQITLRPDWKPSSGKVDGTSDFRFSTGGPAIVNTWPSQGSTIEEDQHFLVQTTGPVRTDSLSKQAWCEVDGVGDRLPVKVVTGSARDALVVSHRLKPIDDRVLLLACQRPFPADTKVRLIWGAGIQALKGSVPTRAAQSVTWQVREPFLADFSCEREKADKPCMPLRPLTLRFNAAVPQKLAAEVRLTPASGAAVTPQFTHAERQDTITELSFAAPLSPSTAYTLSLPAGLKDESGRPLSNADSFPLRTATGPMPPLVKFAAAPFGILEAGPEAMLPITVRRVQADLKGLTPSGQIRIKRLDASHSDADLLRWLGQIQRYHESQLTAKDAGLPKNQWTVTEVETDAQGRQRKVVRDRVVGTRELSLLRKEVGVEPAKLPMLDQPSAGSDSQTDKTGVKDAAGSRPFEVLGVPLTRPGYHVVEVESKLLGQLLLAPAAPMYVRTGVLVTQLGVHFKRGRQSSLVWVTTLDRAKPVPNADVAVNDCTGQTVWSGRTDAQGLARIPRGFDDSHDHCLARAAWFVTARAKDAQGQPDLAFVFSDWVDGIEPWRFNLSTASGTAPDWRTHTVFDRTLLRAGETVSMKHFARLETTHGLKMPPTKALPKIAKITHVGSGDSVEVPLRWRQGAGSATSQWAIPASAKLGAYEVALLGEQEMSTGSFRLEAFRLPMVDARLSGPKGAVIAPTEVPMDLQLNYLSGGAMTGTAATLTALLRERAPTLRGYDDFNFDVPRRTRDGADSGDSGEDGGDSSPTNTQRIVADRLPVRTDAQGAARVAIKPLPALTRPGALVTEVSFADPNGEIQTVSQTVPLWPSAVVLGLKTRSWMARGGQAALQAVVLDTQGQPLKERTVKVTARQVETLSTRKRMVGGFYAYEHHEKVKDLGTVCEGRSDARGLLNCDLSLKAEAGEIELLAQTRDDAGRVARAGTTVWAAGAGEQWFEQENDDRIDVLAEQADLKPGETARLQVRMPYREATALVTVEREGVIDSRVMTLRGTNPMIELPVPSGAAAESWAPNVYVSVLVMRGRVRHVPWYSFFDWGWRTPTEWWQAWRHEGPEHRPATAMVDLAKPGYKFGVAQLHIDRAAHCLDVTVTPEQAQYGVRQTARVKIKVLRDGQPAAGAQVAFAAVDEALLALKANTSWDLLEAMWQPRGWGVDTSTGQSEIIGRRHYGRKALPAGGGGGGNPTRELFNTLLLWQPEVTLDAQGEATVSVPLNDSLTSFRLVAVADQPGAGSATSQDRFGTGSATLTVSQDLQLLPGLPPLAREGDQVQVGVTVRNTTGRAMAVETTLKGQPDRGEALTLAPQRVALAAGAATEVQWTVTIPTGPSRIAWTGSAQEAGGQARDQVAIRQTIAPAVPLRIWSASLQSVGGPAAVGVGSGTGGVVSPSASVNVSLAPPGDALPAGAGAKLGGVQATLQATLAGSQPGVRRFFETYPFTCLEQRSSKAVGLQSSEAWNAVMNELPGYLDSDGLASYYPIRPEDAAHGSDRLTAYLIALADEGGYALPKAARDRMLDGLSAFVDGRLQRRFNAPRADDDVRRLAALEALSRHGRAQVRQLATVQITPAVWPTAALLDWWLILRRLPAIPERAKRLQEASALLRSRLDLSGTQMRFVDEAGDFWWWLMDSPDSNAVRLVLAAADQPDWADDMPRLVMGALGRQQRGAWLTTTANAWGTLALKRFSARFEKVPVAGHTQLTLGTAVRDIDWAKSTTSTPSIADASSALLPWPAKASLDAPANLQATHTGSGKPWLTVQTLAAVPLTAPLESGYSVQRKVEAVTQKVAGRWSRGDVLRVQLTIDARADMSWVAVSDPLPTGAAVLGTGLGRDSQIATQGENAPVAEGASRPWPAYIERGTDAWRSVHEWLPKGQHVLSYTVRLSSAGRFQLPPTRVEAMYAPASFAERPNAVLEVAP